MLRVAAAIGSAAIIVSIASWAHFGQVWKGVFISRAGDLGANGYYKWQRGSKAYVKTHVPAAGWRVPNVYDLVSRAPAYSKNSSDPLYIIREKDSSKDSKRFWYLAWHLSNSWHYVYYSTDIGSSPDTPPSTGWKAYRLSYTTHTSLVEPPPLVVVSGKTPTDTMQPEMDGVELEFARYPGTVLLLMIILAFAYHLWSKRVSPDKVAMSYALIWQDREYWRVFTASFAHFEHLHLGMNAMSTWNSRSLEEFLGTFRFLCLTLNLVVTTAALTVLIEMALAKRKGAEGRRGRTGGTVGFSCVLFAFMTYTAAVLREFCPSLPGLPEICFKTRSIPVFGGEFPINFGPFVSLVFTQITYPRSSLIGHLAGIIMGYLVAWGILDRLSTPILAGASVIFMLQHSRAWAHMMPFFSFLLKDWAGGGAARVIRTRALVFTLAVHVCLAAAALFSLSWGSVLAEMLALAVGFSAVQALKCCCWLDSKPTEHRFCVDLLKAYGALGVVLLVSDLISFGAVLSQGPLIELSGVSESSQRCGLVLLAISSIVHSMVAVACLEAEALFQDGQAFLSSIGLICAAGYFR